MDSSRLFTLFGIPFTSFGVCCSGAFALLVLLMAIDCRMRRGKVSTVAIFGMIALPMVLVISRLLFVAADIKYYMDVVQSALPALRFYEGGYSFMGAVIGIIAAGFICDKAFSRDNKRYCFVDSIAMSLPFAIAVERLGEYGTGMGLGKVVYTPWMQGIAIADAAGVPVHPVFLYEAICALLIGAGLRIYWRKNNSLLKPGDMLNTFLSVFGACQITLESLRKDGHMVVHFVRIQQIIALLMVIFAIIRWMRIIKESGQLKKSTVAIVCAAVLMCILLCVKQEFAVDSSENPWMDYGIMAFSSLILCLTSLSVGRMSRKGKVARKVPIM